MHNGSCLCGAIHYQFLNEPFDCSYCGCSICRKLTGSNNGAYGSVVRSEFTWTKGQSVLAQFSPTEFTIRYFCSACGSFLLTEHSAEPDNVFVSLGSLDTEIVAKPTYLQFTEEAPKWALNDRELLTYKGWPDEA